MGGRGSSSGIGVRIGLGGGGAAIPTPGNPQQQGPLGNQGPQSDGTPVGLDQFATMTDAQLAQFVNDAVADISNMPSQLADIPDITQAFVWHAQYNAMPQVMDAAAFAAFMKANGITQSQVLSRSVNQASYTNQLGVNVTLAPAQLAAMYKYSAYNYIGGKVGGQVHGAGSYFDMNGGRATGYGSGGTFSAVLNPATARVIDHSTLRSQMSAFDRTHPRFAKALRSAASTVSSMSSKSGQTSTNSVDAIYAMVLGYNVIRAGSYHNVIGREATVVLE